MDRTETAKPFNVTELPADQAGAYICESGDCQHVAVAKLATDSNCEQAVDYYVCAIHLHDLRVAVDTTHDRLKRQARSMLDHPVNQTPATDDDSCQLVYGAGWLIPSADKVTSKTTYSDNVGFPHRWEQNTNTAEGVAAHLVRRNANRDRRNRLAGADEQIQDARARLTTFYLPDGVVDALDELAYAWTRA